MKKQLLLAGFIGLAGTSLAQWTTSGSDVYKTSTAGNVGVGLTTPAFKMDIKSNNVNIDDGIHVYNSGVNNHTSLYLDNSYGGYGWSRNWALQSQGGGYFRLFNVTNALTAIDVHPAGNVVMATTGMGSVQGRLFVGTNADIWAIRARNAAGNTAPIGVEGYATGTGLTGSIAKGINGIADGGVDNEGGHFYAQGGGTSKGVFGRGFKGTTITNGGVFEADEGGAGSILTVGTENSATSNGICIGVRGTASGASGGPKYGGIFQSLDANSSQNIGGLGYAMGGSRFNIGLVGSANLTNPMSMPFAFAPSFPQADIGVYGTADLWGAYASPSNQWAGWFDNDVMINGTGYNSSFASFTSDRKFKKEIKTIENASSIISKLNPSTYYMLTDNEYGLHFSAQKQYGFISQEVEVLLPDLVTNVHKPAGINQEGKEITKAVDYKSLNYMAFIALITKGVQEQQVVNDAQQRQVEELTAKSNAQQQQINELKALVQSLAGNGSAVKGSATSVNVNLSDKNTIVLNQNVPNPFAESTVISYNIPSDFTRAQIIFSTNDGSVIKTIDIKEKGNGSLNVFGNDLSHGMYNYSLVVDGKTIDTKKMIKE